MLSLIHILFLDICMAGTNGIETARRLRQADPEVLIVFVKMCIRDRYISLSPT